MKLIYPPLIKRLRLWGGMVFLKQMLDKIGFREQIENANLYLCHFPIILIKKKKFCLNLLLRVFGVAPIVFAHRNYRADKALGEIFDWRKPLLRTHINAILASLHNTSTSKLGIIFSVGFFRI